MSQVSLPPQVRAVRDGEIARRWLAGESAARLARAYGLSGSGVHRILTRVATGWQQARAEPLRAAEAAQRAKAGDGRTGRRAVWPDCPPALIPQYRKIRSVIGSEAAKAQLLALIQTEGSTTP